MNYIIKYKILIKRIDYKNEIFSGGTRYLHTICCDSTEKKDLTLMKYIPAAKSILERLIYSVKGMLVLNNSPAAFWMGNLVNKNLEGQEIFSQVCIF